MQPISWKREGTRAWISVDKETDVRVNGQNAGRTRSTLEITKLVTEENVIEADAPASVFGTGATAFVRGSEEIRTHSSLIRASIQMNGPKKELQVMIRRNGEILGQATTRESGVELQVPKMLPWDVDSPTVYEVVFTIEGDQLIRRFGARKIETRLQQLLFNGKPLLVRGALYQGSVAELKGCGFNLVKFSGPPGPALDECDDLGMLAWQEYPEGSIKDFEEWFRRDRHHPSLVLRSVPDQAVSDLAHVMIQNAVVSSDIWDERSKLNNSQWRFYPSRLKKSMEGRPARPLILGETIGSRYQIEKVRKELPGTGYVVSEKSRWHGETMLILDSDQRSFYPEAPIELWISHSGRSAISGKLSWKFGEQSGETPCTVNAGETRSLLKLKCPEAHRPARVTLSAKLENASSSWDLWIIPKVPVLPPITRAMTDQATEYLTSGGSLIMVAGPVKGSWKCPEYSFLSPTLWQAKANPMIEDLLQFDLLSGRVLQKAEGVEVLIEVDKNPMVLETRIGQGKLLVSAFRHESPAGRWLLSEFAERRSFLSKFRDLQPSDSIVLESWEMSLDGTAWTAVRADTPLANQGRNVYDGWATFRTTVEIPESWRNRRVILRAEAVGDAYEVAWDGAGIGASESREVAKDFDLTAAPGRHELRFRARDGRGAGGMVGPVYLTTTPNLMVL